MKVTTITKTVKSLRLGQLLRDIDYHFWALMMACLWVSSAVVTIDPAFADAYKGAQIAVAQHLPTQSSQNLSDAYLALKGAALGAKYKERGVVREDLEETLEGLLKTGQISLLYRNAILSGYDKGLTK